VTTPRRTVALAALAAFVLGVGGSLVLHRDSVLHDTDAYYHLAVGRAYAHEGVIDELRWTRTSVLRDGFGDKEFLFHALLAPLAGTLDPLPAGRLGLALLGSLVAAAVTALAARVLGWWGLAVPFWLFFTSTEWAWRLVRLRPELLALVLLLAAAAAIGGGRDRLLGIVAFLFTWSYTAFQALLGLVALAFVYFGWAYRDWRWRMPVYAVLGVGLALLAHPHFPKNLEVWAVQNVHYFLHKGALDVGTEIRPNFTDVVLMVNLGWFLSLAVLAASTRKDPSLEGADGRLADVLGLATLAFGALYLLMSRFSIYFIPFATLWWLYELRRRGRRVEGWTHLPVRGRLPLALAAAACLLVSLPEAWRQLGNYRERTALGPDGERIRDREALSAALPEGARVAADWGATATYMLWAPQGRYLNVLDPVFMALPYPEAHAKLEAILAGREPDVPATAVGVLGSDHLAYLTVAHRELDERLRHDPRVEVLHRGSHTLVRFRPARGFAVDGWAVDDGSTYRPGSPFAGYVDAERIRPVVRCVTFERELEAADDATVEIELAPYGPTSLWLDGALLVGVRDSPGAVLGRGVRVPLELARGRHRVRVVTCEGVDGYKGFYWLARPVGQALPADPRLRRGNPP